LVRRRAGGCKTATRLPEAMGRDDHRRSRERANRQQTSLFRDGPHDVDPRALTLLRMGGMVACEGWALSPIVRPQGA
jgi:hypothetical protein